MPGTQLKELVDGRAVVMPLNVDQYHQMIDTGILEEGEPIELLDGYLVRKDRSKAGDNPITVGPDHAGAVGELGLLQADFLPLGCHVRIQQPVTLPPYDEPEPDAVVARGMPADFRRQGRHPGAADICCVIEVSGSSLQRDRTTKMRIYADAGLPQYVIVNLIDDVVEDYRQPQAGASRYAAVRTFRRGETVRFEVGGGMGVDVPVDRLLP